MIEDYAMEGTKPRCILEMHFAGMPPSEIDRILDLVDGEAKREIVRFWAWDKEEHSNSGWRRGNAVKAPR